MRKKYLPKREQNKLSAIGRQNEQEAEFSRKHRAIAWQLIEDFYYWLNFDPKENTWLVFKKTLKGRGFGFRIVKDFYETFVKSGDLPEGNFSIYKAVA